MLQHLTHQHRHGVKSSKLLHIDLLNHRILNVEQQAMSHEGVTHIQADGEVDWIWLLMLGVSSSCRFVPIMLIFNKNMMSDIGLAHLPTLSWATVQYSTTFDGPSLNNCAQLSPQVANKLRTVNISIHPYIYFVVSYIYILYII